MVEGSTQAIREGLGLNLPGNGVHALRILGVAGSLRERGASVRRREYGNRSDRVLFAIDEVAYWGEADTPAAPAGATCSISCGPTPIHAWVRFGTFVTGVIEADDVVEVSFTNSTTESYDLVVRADAVHSRVRTSLTQNRR